MSIAAVLVVAVPVWFQPAPLNPDFVVASGAQVDALDPKDAGTDFNPAAARKLLAEAGFPKGKDFLATSRFS